MRVRLSRRQLGREIDRNRTDPLLRMTLGMTVKIVANVPQPGFEHLEAAGVLPRQRADDAALARRLDHLGVADEEHRRADRRENQVVSEGLIESHKLNSPRTAALTRHHCSKPTKVTASSTDLRRDTTALAGKLSSG